MHLCTISAFLPVMMQLRTHTVRFSTRGSLGAPMMRKSTPPVLPSMRS